MIPNNRFNQVFPALKGEYVGYLSKQRGLPTEELERTIETYEGKSPVGRFVARFLADSYLSLEMEATKQVLAERVE